jgi:hypothetical protein
MDTEEQIFLRFKKLSPFLNERALRMFVATEADFIGYGGISVVHRATGVAMSTIRRGLKDLEEYSKSPDSLEPKSLTDRVRREGGGRKPITTKYPTVEATLEKLVEPLSKGDYSSPLRWTLTGRVYPWASSRAA